MRLDTTFLPARVSSCVNQALSSIPTALKQSRCSTRARYFLYYYKYHELTFIQDGTRVPMFITRKKGQTEPGPTILYGYGGFNISMTPTFSVCVVLLGFVSHLSLDFCVCMVEFGRNLRCGLPSWRRRIWTWVARCRKEGQKAECIRWFHFRLVPPFNSIEI